MHAICTTPRRAPWPWIVGAAALMGALVLSACSTPRAPEGVQSVTGFDVDRYTGHWHEVARIENSFERGLTQATATYSRSADNTIKVVNRGYDPVRKQWKEAEGRAEFVDSPNRAALKVSFFGPFMAATTWWRWTRTTSGPWWWAPAPTLCGCCHAPPSCPGMCANT